MAGGFDANQGGFVYGPAGSGGSTSIGSTIGGSPTTDGLLYTNSSGQLAQSVDADPSAVPGAWAIGRVRLGSTASDDAALSHYDQMSTSGYAIKQTAGGGTMVNSAGGQNIGFATSGTQRWLVSSGGHLLANADATYDIGATTTTRPRNIYASGDVQIATSGGFKTSNAGVATSAIGINGNVLQFNVVGGQTIRGHAFIGSAATSGATDFFSVTPPAHTGQTASTEIQGFHFNTHTRTWATGAIATQREFRIDAPTYAFAAASTVTDAATLYVSGAPIAGANATITNAFALWSDAGLWRYDGSGVALGGGAAATLGTIGGSGPAAAAQNQWLQINVDGTNYFVPAWA